MMNLEMNFNAKLLNALNQNKLKDGASFIKNSNF